MQEINFYDLLRYYARNWLNLLSALLIGSVIGVGYTAFVQVPLYKSEATMLVVSSGAADTTRNNNYTELFKSRLVLDTTIDKQGYNGDYDQLLSRTTATNSKNTDVIRVSIADTDPNKSQALLGSAVEAFKSQVSKIYGTSNVKTVDTATLPTSPYNVKMTTQVGLAMAATFFLTVIVLFFVYDYTMSTKGGFTQNSTKDSSGKAKKATTKKSSAKAAGNGKSGQKSEGYASSLLTRLKVMIVGGTERPAAKKN